MLSAHFNKKKIKIINRRLGLDGGEPETLKEIGKKFRLSGQRVQQIMDELKEIAGTNPSISTRNPDTREQKFSESCY